MKNIIQFVPAKRKKKEKADFAFAFLLHQSPSSKVLRWSLFKVEKILKGILDSIPSPSTSVKIQIMDGKVCLRCKGKTLLGVVKKLLKQKNC